MATMKEADTILAECRQILADSREQLTRFFENSRASQWQKINFDLHGEELRALGVPPEVGKAANRFHVLLGTLFEHLDSCRNELASQETELQFSSAPPERLRAAANGLARECGQLGQPLADLQNQFAVLCGADKTLRQKLRLESLLNLAEKASGARSDAFDAGCRVFNLVTGIGNTAGNLGNFQEQLTQASEMKTRLQHVDLQALPCMVAEIVEQQVDFAIDAAERVHYILEQGQQGLAYELATVNRLMVRMTDLAKAPLPDILEDMKELVSGLADCVLAFYSKQHLVRKLQAVAAILECLKLFNRALKSEVLPFLKAEIGKAGAPLNPATLAARNAEKYFAGPTGLWRMIKLFFQSGGKGVDAISLQLDLENAINDCTAYRGIREVDLKSLRAFIVTRLQGFRQPFPHEELSRLMKTTLDTYAARVEKTLSAYRLTDELLKEFSAGVAFLEKKSPTFGTLLRSVQRQTGNLERGLV